MNKIINSEEEISDRRTNTKHARNTYREEDESRNRIAYLENELATLNEVL